MTDRYDVYEAEGELLESAMIAAINEHPFELQKSLDDLTDQVRLLDHITEEAQEYHFSNYSDEMAIKGFSFNASRFEKENAARQKLANEYNALFKR